jgi:hypothetical protein
VAAAGSTRYPGGLTATEERPVRLTVLDHRLAVCGLDGAADLPGWAHQGNFFSITRGTDELSVVCLEGLVPEGVRAERGWRAMRVVGVIDFSVIGVLARLTVPLAEAGIGVFAVSTFDTDYLLVKEQDLGEAIEALRDAGHILDA